MHITEMRVTPIAISDPPLLNAAGLHAPYALRTIVELITDDGLSGVGEVPGSVETTEALNAARTVVIGADPFHLNAIEAESRCHVWHRNRSSAAVSRGTSGAWSTSERHRSGLL